MKLKEITYRLYFVTLSVLAMVALVACGSNENELLPDEPTYTISLKLRTNGIFTRANEDDPTWNDNDNPVQGTELDNVINNVDLFILDENNNISTRLYALEGEQSSGGAYTYVCTVTEKTPGVTIDKKNRVAKFNKKFKIMAVANVVSQYTPWFDGDWAKNKIPFKVNFSATSNDWYIPMWGINTYENVEIKDKVLEKLEDIDLLRAVSKIVIKLHSSISADYEIESVTMADESSLFYAGGYGLPNEALTVEKTTDLKLTGCFNPIALGNNPTMKPVFKYSSNNQKEVITYVPESSIDTDKPFAFNVTLKNINEEYPNRASITGTLYLSNYSPDGTQRLEAYTSVVRNHIYEFTVKIKMSTLQFKVDVVPYRSCELEPFFGL